MAKWVDLEKTDDLAQAMYNLFSKCHLKYKVGCFADDCYECVRRFLSPYGCGHLFPAVDVQEVKHGKWNEVSLDDQDEGMYICSECKSVEFMPEKCDIYTYCPNCGAKMDGKEAVKKDYNPCNQCRHKGWDMPQCHYCNKTNEYKYKELDVEKIIENKNISDKKEGKQNDT